MKRSGREADEIETKKDQARRGEEEARETVHLIGITRVNRSNRNSLRVMRFIKCQGISMSPFRHGISSLRGKVPLSSHAAVGNT